MRKLAEATWIVTMNAAVVDAHATFHAFDVMTPVGSITHGLSAAADHEQSNLGIFSESGYVFATVPEQRRHLGCATVAQSYPRRPWAGGRGQNFFAGSHRPSLR
jgi:hypothetical protein